MIRTVFTTLSLGLLSFTLADTSHTNETPGLSKETKVVASTTNSLTSFSEKQAAFDDHALDVYNSADLTNKGLSFNTFKKALVGYHNFKEKKLISSSKTILTVIDFSKPSSAKRLWIIDLKAKKLLFNTLVAHGRNTGGDKAVKFSNQPNSYMSSLGFYLTNVTYYGKHGLSLRLSGMDKGYNTNAMQRAIVLHGADYVSEAFVNQYGRLGRSLGCPAVPQAVSKDVINTIKDKTVLFIHGEEKQYTSDFLNPTKAVEAFALETMNAISNS